MTSVGSGSAASGPDGGYSRFRSKHLGVIAVTAAASLRLLTGRAGTATVQYGSGDGRLAHGPEESVAEADVAMAVRTLALLALDLCGG